MADKTVFLKHYNDHIGEILRNPSGQHGVDPERLEEWIAAQQSETRRALARALSEQIVYVTFDEVKDMCRTLVQQVYAVIPTEVAGKVVWWVGEKNKSGYFISILCYHYLLELGLPKPGDIVIDLKTFESGRIYLKWDDMTYSGSQLEKLNHAIIQDYLKEGRTNYPDVRHCLIAATTNAVRRLQQPMFLGKEYPISSRKFPAIATFLAGRQSAYIDIPFQTYIVREFPTLDETLGPEMHYVCDWFFNRQSANCAVYFDHKIADNVSTQLKVLLYGVVPPATLDYVCDYGCELLKEELEKKYGALPDLVIREEGVDSDIEVTQFKPFLRGCPSMEARFRTWALIPFDEFMIEYSEYARGSRNYMNPPLPNWDDAAIRCPTAWYKTYFKGGSRRRGKPRHNRHTRQKLRHNRRRRG